MKVSDIIIVGFGGAGASAAIEAHDAGARVLILEKASEGGGNTQESGGTVRKLKNTEGAVLHYEALTGRITPRASLEVFAKGVTEVIPWLTDVVGAELVPWVAPPNFPPMHLGSSFPDLPGADALDIRVRVRPKAQGEPGGKSLWDALFAAVQKRDIEVIYGARTDRLSRTSVDGPITGVEFEGPEGKETVRAKRAVILTCGGFEYNEDMHKTYVGGVGLNAFGPPGRNTGDGITMAMEVGADLWHMNAIAGPFGYKFSEYEAAFTHRMPGPGYIYVDRDAQRFLNEPDVEFHSCALAALAFDPVGARYPRIPSYVIFDKDTRIAGPISSAGTAWNRRFPWSRDNSVEIERGWIKAADTVGALGRQLGLTADALAETLRRYNDFCSEKHDKDFGRRPEYLVPIAKPPFYGVELWPCLLNTQGGPRRNERAQVMSVRGTPIARLYSAGELGSIWGMMYPGAGNVSEALVFGRIAGRNAAAEPALEG